MNYKGLNTLIQLPPFRSVWEYKNPIHGPVTIEFITKIRSIILKQLMFNQMEKKKDFVTFFQGMVNESSRGKMFGRTLDEMRNCRTWNVKDDRINAHLETIALKLQTKLIELLNEKVDLYASQIDKAQSINED